MGVEITAWNGVYGDGVKVGTAIGVPHWLTPPNGLWCIVIVVYPEPKFLVGVVLNDDGAVDTWWYLREDRELKKIDSKDCVLLQNWYLGSGRAVMLSSSEDMVLFHALKCCDST